MHRGADLAVEAAGLCGLRRADVRGRSARRHVPAISGSVVRLQSQLLSDRAGAGRDAGVVRGRGARGHPGSGPPGQPPSRGGRSMTASASEPPLLRITALTKRFGGFTALDNVSVDIRPGERLGLIGPNGSGKTTLINCISGAFRTEAGTVMFRGEDITRMPPHLRTRRGTSRCR